MRILCKCCGAGIDLNGKNDSFVVCEYCGCKSMLPSVREDYVINLFNRANQERLNKNFDDALSAYEAIISEIPSEAEAHWGAFLCLYGVEYVEDAHTGSRLPTIHRMSAEPVLNNHYYISARNAATSEASALYKADAEQISKVQEKFYKITANEKPFDVFISYKETMGPGNPSRTQDSIYAQEIYEGLKREGYNVFFSRITLAEKAGDCYEPIIFSALNTSKLMLLVTTGLENVQSTWVKNEWKRYLYMMQTQNKGQKLVIAYRDFDIYSLPDELSDIGIRYVDLSEHGAVAELVRNVAKVLGPKSDAHYDADILFDRTLIDIACGDFEEAARIADMILNGSISYWPAYIVKVMCDVEETEAGKLLDKDQDNWSNETKGNWVKGISFMKAENPKMDSSKNALQGKLYSMKKYKSSK